MATWTINRAFLQELKDANADYWQLFADVEKFATDSPDSPQFSALYGQEEVNLGNFLLLLRRLKTEMAKQFLLEETYGYMQTPTMHSATFTATVEQAYKQHQSLFLLAAEICESAERGEFQGKLDEQFPHLISELQRLYRLWNEHEQLERKLIYGKS
jgi:hypothetical protein